MKFKEVYERKFMRLGSVSKNDFFIKLNKKNDIIQEKFLNKITENTKTIPVKVMLGDSTVKEVETFEPKQIEDLFNDFLRGLNEWQSNGISHSLNDDIRRIFAKFVIHEEKFVITLHVSIQFHVLLYYRPEQKVLDLQKEASDIIDKTNDSDSKYSEEGNKIILQKLEEMGYDNINEQNLFELFYNDEKLAKILSNKIESTQEDNIVELNTRKKQVLGELDNLLIETFQTSNVIIDEQKLVNGEEGCLCNIDIEYIENDMKQGLFDLILITDELQDRITKRVDEISLLVNN